PRFITTGAVIAANVALLKPLMAATHATELEWDGNHDAPATPRAGTGRIETINTDLQDRIQRLIDRLVAEGKERGLQVAAYVDGRLAVNAWAGIADASSGRPVDERTLFPVFSATKGVAATVIHGLVERGLLAYDEPIATVWPEFASHGKERITLRQALNHSAGLPQMPRPLTYEELHDWDTMCARIANLAPLWPPGTRIEYHAITYGWLVGEAAQRVTGRSFGQLVTDEIARPLGVTEEMFVGIPDDVETRVATLEEPGAVTPPDDGLPQSIPVWMGTLHDWMNRADARRACLPASNGIMSALALARHYAALLPGGIDGIELLPPDRVRLATAPQKPDQPENDEYPRNRALGYGVSLDESRPDRVKTFGHGGYGGCNAFAEPDRRFAVAINKNLLNQHDSASEIVQEIRNALDGIPEGVAGSEAKP
ncbi:MAG: serine hydrolase domain-containing protein, partial [Armatimonadota bacterium]